MIARDGNEGTVQGLGVIQYGIPVHHTLYAGIQRNASYSTVNGCMLEVFGSLTDDTYIALSHQAFYY